MKIRIGILTGGFDPITAGHIALFKDASSRCDKLVAFVNSDQWLARKRGLPPIDSGNLDNRCIVLRAIRYIDEVIRLSSDHDLNNSSKYAITICEQLYPNCQLIFMNGGDRDETNTPETELLDTVPNLRFEFGVGGVNTNNIRGTNKLLKSWNNHND